MEASRSTQLACRAMPDGAGNYTMARVPGDTRTIEFSWTHFTAARIHDPRRDGSSGNRLVSRRRSSSDGLRENKSGLSEIAAARHLSANIESFYKGDICGIAHSRMTRRNFLKAVPTGALSLSTLSSAPLFAVPRRKPSDIRVKEIACQLRKLSLSNSVSVRRA